MPEHSIGRVKAFWGNWLAIVRAYAYIRQHGGVGLRKGIPYLLQAARHLDRSEVAIRVVGGVQVARGYEWTARIQSSSEATVRIPSIRGEIRDRNHGPIAVHHPELQFVRLDLTVQSGRRLSPSAVNAV